MSCCVSSPESAGIGGLVILVLFVMGLIIANATAILHFLLMVFVGAVIGGAVVALAAGSVVWKVHRREATITDRYNVGMDTHEKLTTGGSDGTGTQALEAGPEGSIGFDFWENGDGTVETHRFQWADGSPVRPVRREHLPAR